MTSSPCKETEEAVKNFLFKRLGDREEERKEIERAFRHAVGNGWQASMACRECWNYIYEMKKEAAKEAVERKSCIYAGYTIRGSDVVLLFTYDSVLRLYCNLSLPRTK